MTDTELQKNRFIAMAIDIGIAIALTIVFVVVNIIAALVSSFLGHLVNIIGAAVMCAYFLLRDFLMSGNSPGKHLMKIRVVSETGAPIDIMQSAKRNMVFAASALIWLISSIVSLIPFLGCIAGMLLTIVHVLVSLAVLAYVIWELYTITQEPNGIRWGDKFAGTRVVRQA